LAQASAAKQVVVQGRELHKLCWSMPLWACYRAALQRQPLLTKALTSASLMTVSDTLCQGLEYSSRHQTREGCAHDPSRKPPSYDWGRSSRMAALGFFYIGPISHCWYNVLERWVRMQHPVTGIGCKLVLDAFLFSPVAVGGYLACRSKLEGQDALGVIASWRSTWWPALLASWSFWPAANLVSFSVVPMQFRVLYNSTLSVVWNAVLYHLTTKEPGAAHKHARQLGASLQQRGHEAGQRLLHLALAASGMPWCLAAGALGHGGAWRASLVSLARRLP